MVSGSLPRLTILFLWLLEAVVSSSFGIFAGLPAKESLPQRPGRGIAKDVEKNYVRTPGLGYKVSQDSMKICGVQQTRSLVFTTLARNGALSEATPFLSRGDSRG